MYCSAVFALLLFILAVGLMMSQPSNTCMTWQRQQNLVEVLEGSLPPAVRGDSKMRLVAAAKIEWERVILYFQVSSAENAVTAILVVCRSR